MSAYHTPVLVNESVSGLVTDPEGTYVDVTFGGGGHSREILSRLNKGRLFGFDQDREAQKNVPEDSRFTFFRQDFRYLKNNLKLMGVCRVSGILADLGVSSHQFDTGDRGFSFRLGGPLDMRMNPDGGFSASELIRGYSEKDLARVFFEYGEIRNARKLAREIAVHRESVPVETIHDLLEAIDSCVPENGRFKYLAKVFQALRIEVNKELEKLKQLLLQSAGLIEKKGRLVVITYHSLEDRIVKNFLKNGKFSAYGEKDIYGRTSQPFKPVNRKVIVPGYEEVQKNPRARSAKLRIAERI